MKLKIPSLPVILQGQSEELWRRWYAFWALPSSDKATIIDEHPSLIIERATPPETRSSGGPDRYVFFNPEVFDSQIPDSLVFGFWKDIEYLDTYPTQQRIAEWDIKSTLFGALNPLNFAVLAYKYRYVVRPENYYIMLSYETDLFNVTTAEELQTFYDGGA